MLIKTTPDKEKVSSILKMVETTLEMVKGIDHDKFSSNVTKVYYDSIRELISVILLLDGYKTIGEVAHKELIAHFSKNYREFSVTQVNLIDELRIIRNRISYDAFFINPDYLERNKGDFVNVIKKLKEIIKKKM